MNEVKCYSCSKLLPEGHLSWFCNDECKKNYWKENPTKTPNKYNSISKIQIRCKQLAKEAKLYETSGICEEAVKVFTGGLI